MRMDAYPYKAPFVNIVHFTLNSTTSAVEVSWEVGITEKKKEKAAWDFQENIEMLLPFSLGLGQEHQLGHQTYSGPLKMTDSGHLCSFIYALFFSFFFFLFNKIKEFPSFSCQ